MQRCSPANLELGSLSSEDLGDVARLSPWRIEQSLLPTIKLLSYQETKYYTEDADDGFLVVANSDNCAVIKRADDVTQVSLTSTVVL
jgi:hypothetical protein